MEDNGKNECNDTRVIGKTTGPRVHLVLGLCLNTYINLSSKISDFSP